MIAPAQAEQASPVSEATGAAAAQTAQSVRQRFDSPKPLVRNTSGLSTEGLPPPPVRRERPPFIRQGSSQRDPRRNVTRPTVAASLRSSDTQDGDQAASPKPMPRLPPRLPPRTASAPRIMPPDYSADADPENGILSQSSSRNLAAAGIYVPGLDIDLSLSSRPQPQAPGRSMPPPKPTPQISELRSLFSRQTLTSNQPPSPASQPATTTTLTDPSSTTPSQGTTWAQKQAALRTASTFHKDPTSVSLADTRAAASVATNFRDRHGGQVKTGVGAANTLNQKYGLAGRVGAFAGGKAGGGGGGGVDGAPGSEGGAGTVEGAGAVARVPPSVPRRNVIAAAGGGGAPPPVPLASRPR